MQDMDGRAALHMASSKGEIKVVEALMVSDVFKHVQHEGERSYLQA